MAVSQQTIEILIKARDKASKELQNVNKQIKKNGQFTKSYSSRFDKLQKAQSRLHKSQALTVKNMNKVQQQFDGAALSVMFFGMALTRVATQIWTAGTKTFQDVMHSVDGTVTSFDLLNAAGDTLKFTLGAALEPIAAQLVPIVNSIADWVSNNEDLVRDIVTAFAVGGSIMTAFGIVKLGLVGVSEKFTGVWDSAKLLKNRNWSQWGKELSTSINNAIGTVAIFWALEAGVEAYKDFKSEKIADGILGSLQSGAFAGAFISKKGKGALFAIGVALELIKENTFFQTVLTIGAFISGFFITIGQGIRHSFSQGIINGMIDGLDAIADTLSGGLLNFLGIDIGAGIKDLMGVKATEFDFMANYKENIAAAARTGAKLDADFAEFKKSIDESVAEMKKSEEVYIRPLPESQGFGNLNPSPIVNINVNSEDESLSVQSQYAQTG